MTVTLAWVLLESSFAAPQNTTALPPAQIAAEGRLDKELEHVAPRLASWDTEVFASGASELLGAPSALAFGADPLITELSLR